MANFCQTNVTFYSENKKELSEVRNILESVCSHSENEYHNDKGWLGFISKFISNDSLEKELHSLYRGWITSVDDSIDTINHDDDKTLFHFEIHVHDAWTPHITAYDELCNKFKFVNYAFKAEEPGMDVYDIYDPLNLWYTDYKFHVILYYYDETGQYYDCIEDSGDETSILDYINQTTNNDFTSFSDVEKCEYCCLNVKEFEHIDINDYREIATYLLHR